MISEQTLAQHSLPKNYSELTSQERRQVRETYAMLQAGRCMYCRGSLHLPPGKEVTEKRVDWDLFPEGFLDHPVHLQHCHKTDKTEGAIHAYCNAVLWQYEGR